MIDVTRDQIHPVRELLAGILRKKIHPATIWRWTRQGLKNGARLEVVKVGQQLYSTAEAVRQFTAACAADLDIVEMPSDGPEALDVAVLPQRPVQRATDADLRAAGIL
jgi:hypothetical protein